MFSSLSPLVVAIVTRRHEDGAVQRCALLAGVEVTTSSDAAVTSAASATGAVVDVGALRCTCSHNSRRRSLRQEPTGRNSLLIRREGPHAAAVLPPSTPRTG